MNTIILHSSAAPLRRVPTVYEAQIIHFYTSTYQESRRRQKSRLLSDQLETVLLPGEGAADEEGSSDGSTMTANAQIQECATAEPSIVEIAPTEIIDKILNNLFEKEFPDICSALCFGLTSRRNWAILRNLDHTSYLKEHMDQIPSIIDFKYDKIPLFNPHYESYSVLEQSIIHKLVFYPYFFEDKTDINHHIKPSQRRQLMLFKKWMGPKYRLPSSSVIPYYLSCAVYGEPGVESIEEAIHRRRYSDFIRYIELKQKVTSPFGLDMIRPISLGNLDFGTTRLLNHFRHIKVPRRQNPTDQPHHQGLSVLSFNFHYFHLRYTQKENTFSANTTSTFKMPPKSRPPPKSTQANLDNFVLQTSASNTSNTPAAGNNSSLASASARNNRTAPVKKRFQVRGPLLANLSQGDGAEIDREQVMRLRNMVVQEGLNTMQNFLKCDPSQVNYACTSKKRPAEKTKSEENGTGDQPARKKRYNTAKRRAAKFNFPTEIIRLILRCLISEHQTFESDFCTAVCFALTCRPHWAIFRSIHSPKVSLLVQSPKTWNPKKAGVPHRLGDLLIDWMLPAYRPLPCRLLHGEMVLLDVMSIDVFVSIAAYPDVGGEKDKRLAERIYEYRRNCFLGFYCIYNGVRSDGFGQPAGLNWFVPNPYRMGEKWYSATTRFLKHTIFKWKSDCHLDREYHWLNDKEEYSRHYRVWSTYKTWMLRDWVEAQPEAMAYKRSRGLGEDKAKVGMRDGFEMLKLVDVRSEEHKDKIKQVVNAMLRLVKGSQFYGEY
ncbi:uncharacterized protein Bfra_004065 [Botrytis fragariae]|uniref:Uncharacterized protein n=1 Tax=Botrytis fragariae TaxID=1964551 RepID=A0A8H6AUT8_9HELO|nr:uncharacterized protein Bfra_004065 [Botrytis fragariae]KAF5874059.1 hypothetical protein Bfra_004065 [Botrytis fragariae]